MTQKETERQKRICHEIGINVMLENEWTNIVIMITDGSWYLLSENQTLALLANHYTMQSKVIIIIIIIMFSVIQASLAQSARATEYTDCISAEG